MSLATWKCNSPGFHLYGHWSIRLIRKLNAEDILLLFVFAWDLEPSLQYAVDFASVKGASVKGASSWLTALEYSLSPTNLPFTMPLHCVVVGLFFPLCLWFSVALGSCRTEVPWVSACDNKTLCEGQTNHGPLTTASVGLACYWTNYSRASESRRPSEQARSTFYRMGCRDDNWWPHKYITADLYKENTTYIEARTNSYCSLHSTSQPAWKQAFKER